MFYILAYKSTYKSPDGKPTVFDVLDKLGCECLCINQGAHLIKSDLMPEEIYRKAKEAIGEKEELFVAEIDINTIAGRLHPNLVSHINRWSHPFVEEPSDCEPEVMAPDFDTTNHILAVPLYGLLAETPVSEEHVHLNTKVLDFILGELDHNFVDILVYRDMYINDSKKYKRLAKYVERYLCLPPGSVQAIPSTDKNNEFVNISLYHKNLNNKEISLLTDYSPETGKYTITPLLTSDKEKQ